MLVRHDEYTTDEIEAMLVAALTEATKHKDRHSTDRHPFVSMLGSGDTFMGEVTILKRYDDRMYVVCREPTKNYKLYDVGTNFCAIRTDCDGRIVKTCDTCEHLDCDWGCGNYCDLSQPDADEKSAVGWEHKARACPSWKFLTVCHVEKNHAQLRAHLKYVEDEKKATCLCKGCTSKTCLGREGAGRK